MLTNFLTKTYIHVKYLKKINIDYSWLLYYYKSHKFLKTIHVIKMKKMQKFLINHIIFSFICCDIKKSIIKRTLHKFCRMLISWISSLSLLSFTRSIILTGSLRNNSTDAYLKLNHIHLYWIFTTLPHFFYPSYFFQDAYM